MAASAPPRPSRLSVRRYEFSCSSCGYGAVASTAPVRCPICGSTAWELAATPVRRLARSRL